MADQTTLTDYEKNYGIKKPGTVDFCSEEEYAQRVAEIVKCKNDVVYFAEKYFKIIHPDHGAHIIKMYEKQKQLVKLFTKSNRTICLASRQCGKTTSYTAFVLWSCIFNSNYRVLIVSDKAESSIEFLDRIKYAYEELPNWIKPGVPIFNRLSVEWTNGSRVVVAATTPNAGKGKSNSLLIVDEAAAVDPKIMRAFWGAVYPTISSGKKTKIIMVSSSNGPGNLFYDLYSAAEAERDGDWSSFRIDWWEVPGRDENWRKKTLRDLNNDEEEFNKQFGNQFSTASTPTLLPQTVIEKYRKLAMHGKFDASCAPKKVHFWLNENEFYINLWNPPRPDRTYIMGVDVADGVGRDYSTITIADITNMEDMGIVATFRHNLISVHDFSRVALILAKTFNSCHICVESNGLGRAFLSLIESEPNYYRNIVTPDATKGKVGILSHTFTKTRACLWFKDILTQTDFTINNYDQHIANEMESFVKKQNIKFSTFSHIPGKNDDSLMGLIWLLYATHEDVVHLYFLTHKWMETTGDKKIPQYLEYSARMRQVRDANYVELNASITFAEIYEQLDHYDTSNLSNLLTKKTDEVVSQSVEQKPKDADEVDFVNYKPKTTNREEILRKREDIIQYRNLIEDIDLTANPKQERPTFGMIGFIFRSEFDYE